MKTTLFLACIASVGAFQAPLPVQNTMTDLAMAKSTSSHQKKQANPMETILRKISNNFQPFHGHGSMENDLEEQWQAQQDILRSRRADHLDKEHLKKKYSNPNTVKFDGKVGDSQKSSFGKNLSP